MPIPNTRPCWNPAVPPPPVAGAAVGTGLIVGLGEGVTVGLGDGLVVVLGEGLALALALGEALDDGDAVAEGLIEDDDVGVGGSAPLLPDPEHADRMREARMAKMPQPTAPSLALSPVPAVARTFMEPPRPSSRWQPRLPPQKPGRECRTRCRPCPPGRKKLPERAESHNGKSP